MSATATIAITVGVAVAVLVGFFIVYYLGNVANSIYDVKVGVRKDFDKKVKELQEWVDKDTKQRINWMRDENKEDGKRFKETMEGHLEETFGEMEKNVERLRADVASLQVQIQALQEGRGGRPSSQMPPAAEFKKRPKAPSAAAEPASLGDIEVSRTVNLDHDEAPDMAAPKAPAAPAAPATSDDPTQLSEAEPIRTKPSPPPRPSAKPQPAGRSSVEKKAKQKKKKAPDEFESFDAFSEDFKAGS
ncbi:hypothetical protein RYZ26_06290 [Terasakiella sp. A23]|uniref:hypothetical protein n=1 Tax=Terasakiella sp. FCG-A23 TaxID=3080561 RepID=UPI002955CE64|nr:hypothetical protein [Terasakiella sp. A23]MDV7339193.1 hypothetical protein [Terasakiella sp. A23]